MRPYAVLSIDDSSDDTFLLESACRQAKVNFILTVIDNGRTALTVLRGQGGENGGHPPPQLPDLLLLDLKMPGFTGFEFLDEWQRDPMLHRIPVVVLTSSVHRQDAVRALAMGARDCLVKPTDFSALVDIMKHVDVSLPKWAAYSPPAGVAGD
jgi:CheY-like chemotaxis protein